MQVNITFFIFKCIYLSIYLCYLVEMLVICFSTLLMSPKKMIWKLSVVFFFPVNMIKRNIISYHTKIWRPKPLLDPICSENVLNDEFHSSNHGNNIKSCLFHIIYSFFYHITGTKSQSSFLTYRIKYRFLFIYIRERSLTLKITRLTALLIGLTQAFDLILSTEL